MGDQNLKQFAKTQGIEYFYIMCFSGLKGLLNVRVWQFRFEALARIGHSFSLRKQIARVYKISKDSSETISKVYDIEYGGTGGSSYMYLNALLLPIEFEKITGLSKNALTHLKIIDIGAGSNELLRFLHQTLGVNRNQLSGVDVSSASKEIILKDGFQGYVGRIEEQNFPRDSFDVTFLTYFIDYDTDQERTFGEAIKITRVDGKIILEGKLPCQPFGLSSRDKTKLKFITKGRSIEEDIALIYRTFKECGGRQRKKVILEKIIRSSRYVYSHYGLRKLSSHFLVFCIQEIEQNVHRPSSVD